MIDLQTEQVIPIGQVPKRLPHRPHISTVYRWIAKGGLETLRLGGRVFTSVEALERFAEHRGGRPKPPESTPTPQRQREIAGAERRLRESGI